MNPLLVDEVIHYLIHRWGKNMILDSLEEENCVFSNDVGISWTGIIPLSEDEYKKSIADKIEILNRCGYSEEVREWLKKVNAKPRLGRAVSLQLNLNEKMKEFLT